MTRPIKISDELYQKLKDRARDEGLTLQDALVEVIATPHEGLAKLDFELRQQKQEASSSGKTLAAMQEELQQLQREVVALRRRVGQLTELRNKDVGVFNDWVETWKLVEPLSSRVQALDEISHRHWWWAEDEER